MAANPFEIIEAKLDRIETSISKLKPEPVPKAERYLTIDQVAEMLSVTRVTLWSWEKKRIICPARIGNLKRYRLSDVEKIMSVGTMDGQKKIN